MPKLRTVQKLTREGGWLTVEMKDLIEGDTFRMYEPDDGEPNAGGVVANSEGETEWVVEGYPRLREDGIWEVSVRSDG